jgi:hypothetical protein
MSYEELDAVYKELIEEIAFVMKMKELRKAMDVSKQASAELLTKKLIERCRESND